MVTASKDARSATSRSASTGKMGTISVWISIASMALLLFLAPWILQFGLRRQLHDETEARLTVERRLADERRLRLEHREDLSSCQMLLQSCNQRLDGQESVVDLSVAKAIQRIGERRGTVMP